MHSSILVCSGGKKQHNCPIYRTVPFTKIYSNNLKPIKNLKHYKEWKIEEFSKIFGTLVFLV